MLTSRWQRWKLTTFDLVWLAKHRKGEICCRGRVSGEEAWCSPSQEPTCAASAVTSAVFNSKVWKTAGAPSHQLPHCSRKVHQKYSEYLVSTVIPGVTWHDSWGRGKLNPGMVACARHKKQKVQRHRGTSAMPEEQPRSRNTRR